MKSLLAILSIFSITYFMSNAYADNHSVAKLDNAKYAEIKDSGKPLFLAYHADWCGNCRKQAATLASLHSKYSAQAHFYTVDWDDRKKFDGPVPRQRTTIAVVENGNIVNQLIGEADPKKVEAFIKENLK